MAGKQGRVWQEGKGEYGRKARKRERRENGVEE